MSKNLEAKKVVAAELREKFQSAKSVVLVDYRGLTVEEDTKLRNELRKAGVEYSVIKNRMIKFAIEGLGYDEMISSLEGPTAVAFGTTDPVAPAKILSEFSKKAKKMTIKCGAVDGSYIDANGVDALANLPSREVLIAKIMGSMMSSVTKFVLCVEAIRKKQAGEE